MLTLVLCAAAFVAGLTGSWSPCGFSMVTSLGAHGRGRRATLAACAAFAPGALLGGVLTFGALAVLGALLGAGDVALAAAAVLVTAAAIAEATGRRITPQIRRQVPEHWRRVLPLAVAGGGYGVLLGMGFTTFVLTFAVPALAAVALAVGDPLVGVLAGLAFGAGRALPIVVLAPLAEAPAGIRATELMAERPGILRGFRAADALALALCALALGAESTAAAATRADVRTATDPTADGADLAWRVPGGQGALRAGGAVAPTGGTHVAIGGGLLAVAQGPGARVIRRSDGAVVRDVVVRGGQPVDAVAVSATHVVLRSGVPNGGGDRLEAFALATGEGRIVIERGEPVQVGRPALDGARLVFHVTGRTSSQLHEADLAAATRRELLRSSRSQLTNPSVLGDRLLWVEATPYSQTLRLGDRRARGARVLLTIGPSIEADRGYSTDFGLHRRGVRPRRAPRDGPPGSTTTLWTTALAADAAYVTRLRTSRTGTTRADLVRVER